MNNMRQDGLAAAQYQSDWPGFYPPYRIAIRYSDSTNAGYASEVNYPYFFQYLPYMYQSSQSQTFRCPADNLFEMLYQVINGRDGYADLRYHAYHMAYSYCLNEDGPQQHAPLYPFKMRLPNNVIWYTPIQTNKVSESANFMTMAETYYSPLQGYNSTVGFFRWDHVNKTSMNVLFLDGHVESKTQKEIITPDGVNPDDERYRPPGYHSFWFGRPEALDVIFTTPW
jgi:prepilin-type processing-associated H-X9-DG protein